MANQFYQMKDRRRVIKGILFFVLLVHIGGVVVAQKYASWKKGELLLNNGLVERRIALPDNIGTCLTTSYKPVEGAFSYFTDASTDFSFEANGVKYSGTDVWELVRVDSLTDGAGGSGASVYLRSSNGIIALTLQFLLYPSSPAIRKSLLIKNLSAGTIIVQSIDVEKFDVNHYSATTFSWIFHDYGRRRSIGPYDGNMQDALVIVHNSDSQDGIVIGNEAPGIIKHTSVFWNEESICTGLTHKDARYPFKKYLSPGDSFRTPQVFTMPYNHRKDPDEMLNRAVPDFVDRCLGTRLSSLQQKPTFVYNTWIPFGKEINEKLLMELAKSAAAAGLKEFVIDDGWQKNYGDWKVDSAKFPHGLKPLFDYIKSLGMKPGLWISVGSASPESQVFKKHPEWFVLDKNGKTTNLHTEDNSIRTACFGTGWYQYIENVLQNLIHDYGLEYLKLDFTVVTSPYRFAQDEAGCYAKDHPGHTDRDESLFSNYEQLWRLFDELHAVHPTAYIDCTFETMGGLQLIDYAMLKHAEGSWLSNFSGPDAKGDLRVRNMAWWRSPAMPATALVIGNLEMQDKDWLLHIKSLAGCLPIILGDPRKLSPADAKTFRRYADWLAAAEDRYGIMNFRQDLAGFGEPMEGSWDGFQRINTTTSKGGIIAVFRQGSKEVDRTVTINYLSPDDSYEVRNINGNVISSGTGRRLAEKGFIVKLEKEYDGELFEVRKRE